jgi:NAD(P)-dependent dehydrogenase (short-subunit alcohol dehydrogenase family)
MSVWFVTGASRGLGAEIVREALSRDQQVVAAVRDAEAARKEFQDAGGELLVVTLDVTDERQAHEAVAQAVERFGRIDVLVNNAGRGLLGAVEEASDSAVRAVFDVNVFGLLNVNRAVLPVLRGQRSGYVINIGSVGGFTQGPGLGIYGATKFAIEGLSESMRIELAPLGVSVTVVEPGAFRTDFLDDSSLRAAEDIIDDYAKTAGAIRDGVGERNHTQPGDPAKAAAVIVNLASVPEPPLRIQLGADAVARVEAKIQFVQYELDMWREASVSTNYGNGAPDA